MAEIVILAVIALAAALQIKSIVKLGLKGLLTVSLLVAVSVAGRLAFGAIPSVQPSTYIIIICGAVLGPAAGFLCGILTAFLSSLLMMLGPWTAWQMLCWGAIGIGAGLLKNRNRVLTAVYGVCCGFAFGWVMNLWYYTLGNVFTAAAFLAACAASFTMDLAHAVINGVLLLVLPVAKVRGLFHKEKNGAAAPQYEKI